MAGMTAPRFSIADARRAHEEWGANCGPGALAAIMDMTLDEVRPHMGDFERKHYTNPTLMNAALRSIGRSWTKIGAAWPRYGLVRVQWEGPWTQPGVPMRARYRYTHWVGAAIVNGQIGVFDINCITNGSGWVSLKDWETLVVPYITTFYPRANGKWHITHAIEIQREIPE
jgi:hypothetical protein